jgi:hypothetical protein
MNDFKDEFPGLPEGRLDRAARAALRATAPRMPADLKAALKREARARVRAPAPSWREAARAVLSGSPWGYGLGAAFAAAALILAVRSALGPAATAPAVPVAAAKAEAPRVPAAELAKASADLWSDDDGSDRED